MLFSKISRVLFIAICLTFASVAFFPKEKLWAQTEEDTHDPFADYSEFEEASEEEADVNFFRNGRFLTIAIAGGTRGFTETLNSLYSSNTTFGMQLAYFFDLRTAIQLAFMTSDHTFNLQTPTEVLSGNVSLTSFSMDLKYYFNTQNVTKGLADMNPYFFSGISQTYRSYTLAQTTGFSKDTAIGLNLGGGLEIPIMRRKSYLGLQGAYRFINFKDEGNTIIMPSGNPSTAKPRGDSYDLLFLWGFNF
jgi:hypothetical protein